MFHPEGNSYFSLGKDNLALEYDLRRKGILNRFQLDAEPTHLQVTNGGNLVISDASGSINWFGGDGGFLASNKGNSGATLFSVEQTGNVLLVAREREHLFDVYTNRKSLDLMFDM